jgi:diacylglycerol kinase family enzyme
MRILLEMQSQGLEAEVYILTPESDLKAQIRADLARGRRRFVVAGGDGTIDSVAAALAGSRATLGIIPAGTQNNVALSLGIPMDLPGAVALLRSGLRTKVDLGMLTWAGVSYPFLEVCSFGLLSALFPAADDIQKGNLARIGDFLATLVTAPPADIQLKLDGAADLHTQGHIVLIGNMPYIGPHYPIAVPGASQDGLLDVLVFSNLNKVDLLSAIVQSAGGAFDDPRIHRYHVPAMQLRTRPAMPVMLDGFALGSPAEPVQIPEDALVNIHVQRRALWVNANPPTLQPAG